MNSNTNYAVDHGFDPGDPKVETILKDLRPMWEEMETPEGRALKAKRPWNAGVEDRARDYINYQEFAGLVQAAEGSNELIDLEIALHQKLFGYFKSLD